MKPFKCPRCKKSMRVVYAGNDDGGQVREESHLVWRRARTNLNDGRKGEHAVIRIRTKPKLVKFWAPEMRRAKTRQYRLRLHCRNPKCDRIAEVRARSKAIAIRTLRNTIRWKRQQLEQEQQ